MVGYPRHEVLELEGCDGRARRVVGGAQDDHSRTFVDGVEHRVEVVPVIGQVGNTSWLRARHGRDPRVSLEGPPCEDDVVAGSARRLNELVQDGDGTRPDDDLVRVASPLSSDRVPDGPGRGFGVSLNRCLGDRVAHPVGNGMGVLVRRQFECVRRGGAALLV